MYSLKLEDWWIRDLCLLSNCLPNLMKKLNGNKSLWMCANRQKYNKFSVLESMLNYLLIKGWIAFKKHLPFFFFSFLTFIIDSLISHWLTFHFLQINGNDKWTTIVKYGAKFLLTIWNHLNNSQRNNLFGLKCMRYCRRNLF